jgi:hypothetical protein
VRKNASSHLIVVALISLAVPAAAAAQPTWAARIDAVREGARLHAGPFYARPQLLLKELGTDSNVFNAAGDQKSDFTMTISPLLEMWVPVARRALLKTSTAADLVYYARCGRTIGRSSAGAARRRISAVLVFGETAYLNTRQRPNYEIDVRSRRRGRTAGADVAISLGSPSGGSRARRSGMTPCSSTALPCNAH